MDESWRCELRGAKVGDRKRHANWGARGGFSAPRPRPSKSPGIHRKTRGRPRAIPECEHQPDWVAVGAVSSEPVSHVDKRIKDEYLKGPYYVPLQTP